jgi:hypothetical protein
LNRAIKGLRFQQDISKGTPSRQQSSREGAMVYLFFTSVTIYLLLVAACNARQRKDVCFTGLRFFIGALALVALLDSIPGWNAFLTAATADPGTSYEIETALQGPESGLPISSAEEPVKIEKDASEYRLKARAAKFLAQGEREFNLGHPAAQRVRRFHEEDRSRIAARTALLGILLRHAGK